MTPETLTIDVGDASFGAVRWPGHADASPVLAVHGITANAWCWGPVARHLAGDATLVAVDLRGRGSSAGAPGPFGIRRHADDVVAVADALGIGPLPVVAHSMGTYVAMLAAERHPATVDGLVLVDGAVPLVVPEAADIDTALDIGLGPALARLRQRFPDRDSYRSLWAEHPAFASGLTTEIEAWLLGDLVAVDGGFRSGVSEEAVRADGAELFVDEEVRSAIDRLARPATIVRAERGLLDRPPPLIALEFEDRYRQHRWITVADTNHYDVLVGERGAAVVADAIRSVVGPG